jgi:5-methylcytosine-specific restriction protein B
VAPDVSRAAWGHKYFSLLYPDKLDDYHNPDYQRFHLIKLLQVPPAGEGRYLAAGRYVVIANELGLHLNQLTTILNHRNARPHRYWRIGTSDGRQPRNRWALMRDGDCVAIGWPDLGDLSGISYDRDSKEEIRERLATSYPSTPQMIGRKTQEVFNFVAVIADGDLVLAADGSTILGIGKVIGDYAFEPASDFSHRRPVEWLSLEEWRPPNPEGLQTTVCEFKKDVRNLIEVERHLLQAPPVEHKPSVDPVSIAMRRLEGIPGRIQSVLERKSQVILYGPPGTGKTYWAEKTAYDLAAYARFGKAFDQLSDDQRAVIVGHERETGGLVGLCSFHPAYGYEDFLEGYHPQERDGQLTFKLRDGIFKKLCEDAQNNPAHKFYLIIDEINRGDIPRIFGELLTVMEKDKRGKPILLPLSGKSFSVPDNVYLIGTMNTADRSIALLDTALRRRFGFIELMPDSKVLGNAVVESIPLGPWLDALNAAICEHIGRDARNLQIGHAYLLDDGKPVSNFAKFARMVQDDILPLLEEYCYEDYATLAKLLGSGLVDERDQRIRHELFVPTRRDGLIQALKAIDPNLDTSAQAITSEAEDLEEEADDEVEDS